MDRRMESGLFLPTYSGPLEGTYGTCWNLHSSLGHGGEPLSILVATHSPTCPGAILLPTEMSQTGAAAIKWGSPTQSLPPATWPCKGASGAPSEQEGKGASSLSCSLSPLVSPRGLGP